MFSFKWYFEKKWVIRAMGNETIYWDGLTKILNSEVHSFLAL